MSDKHKAIGNVDTKSDAGTYSYEVGGKPYAIVGTTDPNDEINLIIGLQLQTITYTDFNSTKNISQGGLVLDMPPLARICSYSKKLI